MTGSCAWQARRAVPASVAGGHKGGAAVRSCAGAFIAVVVSLAATGEVSAQDRPESLQMDITGVGILTSGGAAASVKSITYATFAEPKRTSFSVSLPGRTVTFTGADEAWSDKTHDALTLDSVMELRSRGAKDLPSTGACRMEITEDATFVRKVECSATTDQG